MPHDRDYIYWYNHYREQALLRFGRLTPTRAYLRVPNLGVHNISSVRLTTDQMVLLSKGLKFIPTPKPRPNSTVFEDFELWARRIRIRHMFQSNERDAGFNPKMYAPNKGFEPETASQPLEDLIRVARTKLDATLRAHPVNSMGKDNLSRRLRKALRELRNNQHLRIRNADKNLGITVMDASWEHSQALSHLGDTRNYERVDEVPFRRLKDNFLDFMYVNKRHFSKQELRWLRHFSTEKFAPAKFYVIPKLHKKPISTRPIAASHSWITTPLSIWLDSQLQPILPRVVDSFILNSFSLVYDLRELRVHDGALLVSLDVQSLYPSIPTHLGLRAVDWALSLCSDTVSPNHAAFIVRVLQWLLENNYLEYGGRFYRQRHGTAMGTPAAPPYAIIFMGYLEQKKLWPRWPLAKPVIYKRYIDDIFFVWQHSLAALRQFVRLFNSIYPEIKVTGQYSLTRIEFLDLVIYKHPSHFWETNLLDTMTHAKELNTYLYIPYTSWHSQAMFTAWVKAEIQRHARNNSQLGTFTTRIQMFYYHLRDRGYPPKWLSLFKHINYFRLREAAFKKGPLRVQKQTLAPPLHIATHYNVRVTPRLWNLILEPTDWLRRPIDGIPNSFKHTLLCLKRERNLAEYLTSASFPPDLADKLGWA